MGSVMPFSCLPNPEPCLKPYFPNIFSPKDISQLNNIISLSTAAAVYSYLVIPRVEKSTGCEAFVESFGELKENIRGSIFLCN